MRDSPLPKGARGALDPSAYDHAQKTAMAYWWAVLANFENNAAASFSKVLVYLTENHYPNFTQKMTETIVTDECWHDECCMWACNRLCPYFLKGWKPEDDQDAKALNNLKWVYYNGGRYWKGYTASFSKYRFPLIFTSFMMGEACASVAKQPQTRCEGLGRPLRLAEHLPRRVGPESEVAARPASSAGSS